MKAWRLGWQCDNSHYKIYPSSYSYELINLCWYCWGGGLYPFRQLAGVEFVWNIDNRPPAMGYTVCQSLIWSVTTQRRDCQQNQSVQLALLIATEKELISLFYLQIDQWTPCYCAPELYNKSSILRKIDNWNTKTTNINTITFSIIFQVKIHRI